MGLGSYTVEERLRGVAARRLGLSLREAARAVGASHESIRRWDATYGPAELYHVGVGADRERGEAAMRDPVDAPAELPDDPEELRRIILEQRLELDLMRAVLDVVKKDRRVDPSALTNREKAAVIDAMRPTYSLSCLASRLGIAQSTYHYNRRALARPDKYAELSAKIVAICREHRLTWGYRRVKRELEGLDEPEVRSEKVVLRLMRQAGVQAAPREPARRPSYSAAADTSELPNVPLREDGTHDFSADAPNVLWLTDVTELRVPAGRAYLSPVLDCFDGALAGWAISERATSGELTDPSLRAACEGLREGDAPTCHSDRGAQYHARSWAGICEEHGVARSMSRKGRSPDNARMEGFFGLLKREFLRCRDWEGTSMEEFCAQLDEWLTWYNEGRRTIRLGWKSPMEYRRSLGLSL